PAELLSGDIEYLIEAFDQTGNGPTRVGDENAPLKITRNVPVEKPPDPVTPPPTNPNPTPPATTTEDQGPSGALIAVGVVAGVVVVAAAIAGGGYAFYALRPAVPSSVA